MIKKHSQKIPTQPSVADVTALSHDGRGIAHINGKTTFLLGGLPGEQVSFHYQKIQSQYDEGQVADVLTASPDRVSPRCKHFGICGGCSLQHLHPEKQIQHKSNALLELLQQQTSAVPEELLAPIVGDYWGYRQKARLSIKFVAKKDKVLVGFREKNNRFITDINSCDVLDPSIGQQIAEFSQLFYKLNARTQIPQMEIAVGDKNTAIILRHLVDFTSSDLDLLRQFATDHHYQLYLQPAGPKSIYVDWPQNANAVLEYSLPLYGITFTFKPNQFTQINQLMNQKMVAQAIQLLETHSNDQILDLFCGIGNFSLPIAKYCAHVVGVEGNEDAVQQAIINAKLNSIINARFYCADLSIPCSNQAWLTQSFNKIILDPPRTGAKEFIPQIVTWNPTHILYISCNSATLARDTKLLLSHGYLLKKIGVIDMFPHTQHVEAMALFQKKEKRKKKL